MAKRDSTIRVIQLIMEKGISPKEIHQSTGIKYNTITNALGDNNRNFTIDQISEICEAFNFNQTYCVFGKGEKYGYKASDKIETKEVLNFNDIKEISAEINEKDRTISYLQHQIETVKNEAVPFEFGSIMNVPLVNQYAYAGYLCGYSDPEYIEALPTIPFPVDREYKGQYICFEVKGDSMDDGSKYSFDQGDIVLCREISRDYWKTKLHIKQWNAFVIVHQTEGILIKQIIDHDVENGIITIHSLNPLYEDRQIHLSEVKMLFNVVKMQRNQ